MTEFDAAYDAVVIGGGAAGLNGALMLARARRSVLVVDAGAPRNAPADGVHGLLGREGMPPAELLECGRAEVRGYGGEIVSGEVTEVGRLSEARDVGATGTAGEISRVGGTEVGEVREAGRVGAIGTASTVDGAGEISRADGAGPVSAVSTAPPGFLVTLADGRSVRARRLLVTTGLVDELPEVAGLRERWGRDVVHCPYCHGWEIRDRAIGVLDTGPMSVHQTLLFRQWSADLTFFTPTPPAPEQAEQFAARGIDVVVGEVAGLDVADDRLTGVRLADGRVVARAAIAVAARIGLRIGFLAGLGLRPAEHASGMGEHLPVDPTGRTEVPGVWAAGNVTDPSAQVGSAAAAGAFAAAQITMDLVVEETARAVERLRAGAAVTTG